MQQKYDILIKENELQKELINILKEDRKLFSSLIEYKQEVKEVSTKKKKKKKK